MVITELTKDIVEDGKRLVRALDEAGHSVEAAFWFRSPEKDSWRLHLSVPALEAGAGAEGYLRIREILDGMGSMSFQLPNVSIATWNPYPLENLREAIETGLHLREIRLTGNVLKGRFLPDALIYRLLPATPHVSK